jgi:hypothetical protein
MESHREFQSNQKFMHLLKLLFPPLSSSFSVDFKKENLRTLNPKHYRQIGMFRASEHTHLQRIVNLIFRCWLAMSEQQQTPKKHL